MKNENKKKLLMLHGWGFPSAVFASLREQLATDFVVEMPDRPGYGGSTERPAEGLSAWNSSTRLSSPTLVLGWSLGVQTALQLALDQPHMVTALILLAATPCFVKQSNWQEGMDSAVFESFSKQVKTNHLATMQQFIRLNAAAKPYRHTKEQLNEISGNASSAALLQGLAELESTDLREAIKKITVPVLLLHAVDDRVVPVAASYWLQQNLAQSKLIEYESGGHAFFLQHTTEVASQIKEFQ